MHHYNGDHKSYDVCYETDYEVESATIWVLSIANVCVTMIYLMNKHHTHLAS